MYALKHNFSDAQVRNWIQKQIEYYEQDNVGYFATYEKCSGAFIGQAGLHRFELDSLNGYKVRYMLPLQH